MENFHDSAYSTKLSGAWVLFIGLILGLPIASAAQDTNPEATALPNDGAIADERASSMTDQPQRGHALEEFEQVTWFDVDGVPQWMVERKAHGGVQGTVLLLAAAGDSANGPSHLAGLRKYLPDYGWHTFYTNITGPATVEALIQAALVEIQDVKKLLLICEATSCEPLAPIQLASFAGVVFLNVPYTANTRIAADQRDLWQAQRMPVLVLQEHPNNWPHEIALAVGFELHLLPMGNAESQNSKVMRKLRGWLKRRLGVG